MDLQEEYFKRHDLDHNRLYRYVSYNNLLLVKPDEDLVNKRYAILNIRGTNREGDAGRFDFTTSTVVHNGYKSRMVLSAHSDEKNDKCYWCACTDDKGTWQGFEEKLSARMSYLKKHKYKAVEDPHQIMMACWDMLVFCYDSCIMEMPEHLIDRVYSPLDDGISPQESCERINDTLRLMNDLSVKDAAVSVNCRHVLQGWQLLKEHIDPKNYGWWLIRFFKKD